MLHADDYIVNRVAQDIESMGHTDIVLKGEGEPALVQVMNEVKKKRFGSTIIVNSPAYDPQSNGAIEETGNRCGVWQKR